MRLVRVVSEVCTVNLQLQIVPVLFAIRSQVVFLWAVLGCSCPGWHHGLPDSERSGRARRSPAVSTSNSRIRLNEVEN